MTQNLYNFGDYNTDQILEFAQAVRDARQETRGSEADEFDDRVILYRRPDAAPEPEQFMKTIPLDEVGAMVPDAFAGRRGTRLSRNLTLDQLETIGADGDMYLKEAIKLNLELAAQEEPGNPGVQTLAEYVRTSPAWQL